MRYKLLHLTANGALNEESGDIGYLAFCKHLAFAGIGIHRSPMLAFRYMGFFFEWQQFWADNPDFFSIPSPFDNDPTERNYISNRIGRAFADYFAKRQYGARFTHSYEDVMVRFGFSVVGERPDLYCDNLTHQFAVEAKGFGRHSISNNEMNIHKSQSLTGPVPVHFTVASVAFDLYRNPKIKFYDPLNEKVQYSNEINLQLRSLYYSSIIELIDFFRADRDSSEMDNYFTYSLPPFIPSNLRLMVHKAIIEREWNSNEWLQELGRHDNFDKYESYIDLDGIGLTRR